MSTPDTRHVCYTSTMTGTRFYSTDTDEVRRAGTSQGHPVASNGPTRCGCGVELGPLDIPCHGWGPAVRNPSPQPQR